MTTVRIDPDTGLETFASRWHQRRGQAQETLEPQVFGSAE